VDEGDNLSSGSNDGHGVEGGCAAGLTVGKELVRGLRLGRDNELLHVLNERLFAVGGQEGNVEEGVGVQEAGETTLGPAVTSNEKVAAAEVEDKKPSVNEKTESLVVESLNPSEDSDREMEDVESPDEDSGAESAPPSDGKEEDPVENPIGDGEEGDD